MEKKQLLGKRPRDDDQQHYLTIVEDEKAYNFKVLLPNGTSVGLTFKRSENDDMRLEEFVEEVKRKYFKTVGLKAAEEDRRRIVWKEPKLYLEDVSSGVKITRMISFKCFHPNKRNFLKLNDGVKSAATHDDVWDLTPDTEILMELPQEYTFETALADLIDNSLQAVWSNDRKERRLVRVTVDDQGMSIFDTGPGMDDSDQNSITKWGKMGASLHRSRRGQAIGGNPPYLTPYFGMFGYGGSVASMHLGRHTLVSSKTKNSKKVVFLHLEREALIKSKDNSWKTPGGIRDPLEEEISLSPHGSFTKVEISGLKLKVLDIIQLKCRLKDIYFPYIQCDEMLGSGKTSTPIQFKVNEDDLAELEGGEVAVTNMLSCNGPEFVVQLSFHVNRNGSTVLNLGSSASHEAHARLKCVYFPIVQGKESINRILERLKEEEFKVDENFETFSRVSIRRLGRLLPDARWPRLPIMVRQKKGERAQLFKRCCMRVKCFIDTDAGFDPTPSKTDLQREHHFSKALKSFGNKPEKETDVCIEIMRNEKSLSLLQLEKEYDAWLIQMHEKYDEEIVSGEDKYVIVVLSGQNKGGLSITSDVVRVHKVITRKGAKWRSGQHIKILKGAPNCPKNNMCVTLEYILLEGLQEEACGEARLICRPLEVPAEKGCMLRADGTSTSLDIRCSLSFPLSIIDSEMCQLMEAVEWERQRSKLRMKAPSNIDILNAQDCQQLGIDGALAFDEAVCAKDVIDKEIIAVLRPICYRSSSSSRSLDQKSIIKNDLEMSMEITYIGEDDGTHEVKHIFAQRIKPSSRNGIQGLYIFSAGSGNMNTKLFQESGTYKFLFTVNCEDSRLKKCEKRLSILPNAHVGHWIVLLDEKCSKYHARIGSYAPSISVACVNAKGQHMPFLSTPEVRLKIKLKQLSSHVPNTKVELSPDRLVLNISGICIENSNLDSIRPNYKTNLVIYSRDELYNVNLPCRVSPGPLCQVKVDCIEFEKHLPGSVIKKLRLEMFDRFGNHVKGGEEVSFSVDGLCFQDHKGLIREVDVNGYIDLSGILKVDAGYGETVSLSVSNGEERIFKKEFQVEKRMLKLVSAVPERCLVGSQLEGLIFVIVDSEGVVDETIHHVESGIPHTLKITSEFQGMERYLQHIFLHGRCTVPFISLPQEVGICSILASHYVHPELCIKIQIQVIQPPESQLQSLHGYEHGYITPSHHANRGMLFLEDPSISLSSNNLGDSTFYTVEEIGIRIGDHEKKLVLLDEKRIRIEQRISELQALLEPQALCPLDYFINEKEGMERRIEGKSNTAASVICQLLKVSQSQGLQNPWMQDIIGVVALLGAVGDNRLSRIFAEYLGEDNMLAVICKSYTSASTLEKYEAHGKIDRQGALHHIASEFGIAINGRYSVICIEEISPYTGKIECSEPQRKLDIPNPLLPTRKTPPGFLGYAVNMINLDARYLDTRTTRGYGLRETVFYLLFGKLQVYETREQMEKACFCITDGAVSLDGGIIKGDGILSLGSCEPEICFPVDNSEVQKQLSPEMMEILREVAQKKVELETTSSEIEEESLALSEDKKEFYLKKDRLANYMDTANETLLNEYHLAHSQSQTTPVKKEINFG